MREDFETWASQYDYDLSWSELIDCYSFSVTRILFDTWQASRQALVVELPPAFDASAYDATYYEYAYKQADIYAALDNAGIKWTE